MEMRRQLQPHLVGLTCEMQPFTAAHLALTPVRAAVLNSNDAIQPSELLWYTVADMKDLVPFVARLDAFGAKSAMASLMFFFFFHPQCKFGIASLRAAG